MNSQSPEEQAAIARFSQLLTTTTSLIRSWDERCHQSQRHEHSITVWVVGLCSGGIVSVGSVIAPFLDLGVLPLGALALLYVPFVVGILSGIAHSFILTQLMEAESKFEIARYSALAATPFKIDSPNGVSKAAATVSAIALGKDETLRARERELGIPNLTFWVNGIKHVPMVMFGAGVLAVIFSILAAKGELMFVDAGWVEPVQAALAITGSWFLAFGITARIKVRIGEEEKDVFSTEQPMNRNWKFWLGLGLITLAAVPPVLKGFGALFPP